MIARLELRLGVQDPSLGVRPCVCVATALADVIGIPGFLASEFPQHGNLKF